MIGAKDVMRKIAVSIEDVLSNVKCLSGYDIKICDERIFVDDYAPKHEDYLKRLNAVMEPDGSYDLESMEDGYESPIEMPYQHTIFIILKLGKGEINFGIWNCPVIIQVLSEENCIDAARESINEFIRQKNFIYENGIIQSYFTPDVESAQQEMYAGFRASISVSGFARVPESGIVFAQETRIEYGGKMVRIPFLNVSFNHNAVPDPQPFAGTRGSTMTMNRQTTQMVTLMTYLWHVDDPDDDYGMALNEFSENILDSMNEMNRTFHIQILSNIIINGTNKPITDAYFKLNSATYSQDWGGVEPWSMTFSRCMPDGQ